MIQILRARPGVRPVSSLMSANGGDGDGGDGSGGSEADCGVCCVQVAGFQDEGLKVRTRPPVCGAQSVKTQRAWLSAHGEDAVTKSQKKTL